MKRPTELMKQILQNETAQRIIDFVSPIYGDSYVGLWIYEAIGIIMGELATVSEQLRYETNPHTTELLMRYWEEQYGLYLDSTLTTDERRERLLDAIRSRMPCNPKRLAAAIATVLGVPVEIEERVAKNTFLVNIQNSVSDFRKMLHAINVLNQRKPAHLIYWINVDSKVDETDLKLATATTQEETYRIGVEAIRLSLQATLEKAIKLGATVSIGEEYNIASDSISIETSTDIRHNAKMAAPVTRAEEFNVGSKTIAIETATGIQHDVKMAAPITSAEEYNVEAIKRIARIAVDMALNLSSFVESHEEYNIKEVKTDE